MATQISTAPNVQAPNLSGSQNNASQYFNNFFQGNFSTNGNINDALNAFFEKYTGNAESGMALAATVLYTAQLQNLNPMALLSEFQKLPQGQLNTYLAAFLNINRIPTSQIGIKTTPTTNSYIIRSIVP